MASMTRLRRRLHRWRRYARHTCWNPRITRPEWMGLDVAVSPGHTRAWNAWARAEEDRRCRQIYWPGGPPPNDDGPCDCIDCRDDFDDEDWGEDYEDYDEPDPMPIVDELAFADRGLL